jgi:hypothetical protein
MKIVTDIETQLKMNRSIRIFCSLLLVSFVLFACKKDQTTMDFRTKYLGEFDFTVISNYYGPSGTGIDTNYYSGLIRAYENTDAALNFYLDDENVDPTTKIVVEISQNLTLSSILTDSGVLVQKSDVYFNQSGSYSGTDTIEISRHVSGAATLDVSDFTITGIRK